MTIFLNKKNFYKFIFIYSVLAILFALYVEFILNFKPCTLCIYQRMPYIGAIFISFLGYNYYNNDRFLILTIIIFSISVIISGYHFGIENNIFKEFTGCSANTIEIINKKELLKSLNSEVVNCKDIDYKLFGISLAGLNFLLSLLIVIFSLKVLVYEKN